MSESSREKEAAEAAKLPVSSSLPPQFSPEQEELYRNVLTIMNDCRVPYVVSGAFALHEHTGIWRDTKDLDLFLRADDMPQALRCLENGGYDLEVRDPIWLAKAWRADYFVDLITGMSNAVIRVDQTWIDRAQPSEVLGVPTRILSAEEFIASKIFVTRRERFDGADVAHVIYATRDHLDWGRLFSLLGDHWEMLLWSLIFFRYVYPRHANEVPREVWHELIRRFEHDLTDPKLDAPFRGSLIDENMFAIDVKEWGLENEIEKYRSQHRREHSHLHEKPAA
jgi:uncharacterized nucleotidyltransferase DUF6036